MPPLLPGDGDAPAASPRGPLSSPLPRTGNGRGRCRNGSAVELPWGGEAVAMTSDISLEDRYTVPGRHWHRLDDGRVQCDVCPRACKLREGQRGLCFVRGRVDDQVVLTTYGRSSGFCVDPIEKKPLNHFLPGHAGALVRHRRLQPRLPVLPELGHLQVAGDRHAGRRGVARTTSPTAARAARLPQRGVHLQRPGDLPGVRDRRRRRLPRARHQGGRGHRRLHRAPSARRELYAHMDAANVDLKAFTEDFYRQVARRRTCSRCSTRCVYLRHETDVWFEITTLLIPGHNDSDDEIDAECALDRRAPRARRAAALHRVPPRLQDARRAAARRRRR